MRDVAAVFSEHLRNVPSFVGLPRILERDFRSRKGLLGRAALSASRSAGRDAVGLDGRLRRCTQRWRKVSGRQGLAFASKGDRALDFVLQLAHVAWPPRPGEQFDRRRVETAELLAVTLGS